jgi:hypothetical protein
VAHLGFAHRNTTPAKWHCYETETCIFSYISWSRIHAAALDHFLHDHPHHHFDCSSFENTKGQIILFLMMMMLVMMAMMVGRVLLLERHELNAVVQRVVACSR